MADRYRRVRAYAGVPPGILGNLLQSSLVSLRADSGILLGTTPLAAGTTPQAVTWSGALSQAIGLQLNIDGTGARGTATFKWSINNGATFVATGVLTAATVDLATPGGTVTVAFPVGTYTALDTYKATVQTWTAGTYALTQATVTKQPLYSVAGGSNSQPCLIFDGTDDNLSATFALAQPHHVMFVGKWGGSGTGTIICGADNIMRIWRSNATTVNYFSGAQIVVASVTPDSWHVYDVLFSGASSFLFEDGVSKDTSNVGTGAASGLTIGGFTDGSQAANVSVSEVLLKNKIPTVAERNLVGSIWGPKYALTVATI